MSPTAIVVLIVAGLLGCITGLIARRKAQGFWTWWLFGVMLFVVALPYVLFVLKDKRRRCTFCAERVRDEALVCPHCQRELAIA